MDKEITFADLIMPLWLRRYELILSVLLITVLTYCSLYLLSEKLNYDAEKIYHQDIKFNSELDQKYIQLLSDPNLISYLENELDPFGKEIIFDDTNLIQITTLIMLIYAMLHIISIYLRNLKIVK